jgi:hypothetical protein
MLNSLPEYPTATQGIEESQIFLRCLLHALEYQVEMPL